MMFLPGLQMTNTLIFIMQSVKLLKPLEKPLIVMNYMIVFANGERYSEMNFRLRPNLQRITLQQVSHIVPKNHLLFQKEDLHKWNRNKF